MLVVGWVGWGPALHPTHLTPNEQYTHISLWSLLSAPLLIGCDLTKLDEFTLNLLTNDEVLEVNQDPLGRQAHRVSSVTRPRSGPRVSKTARSRSACSISRRTARHDCGELGRLETVRGATRSRPLAAEGPGRIDKGFTASVPRHGVVLVKKPEARCKINLPMKRLTTSAILIWMTFALPLRAAETRFSPPASPHAIYNFNPGWKFSEGDVTNAEQVDFDDSKWSGVSAPHTYNDVDSYNVIISHSGGDRGAYAGIAWYRKHFKLPAGAKDGKVFLEFEGLKQAGRFWVNGRLAGKYENGVTPCGLDLTGFVNFGDTENVIAVKVDNSNDYKEEATGVEI